MKTHIKLGTIIPAFALIFQMFLIHPPSSFATAYNYQYIGNTYQTSTGFVNNSDFITINILSPTILTVSSHANVTWFTDQILGNLLNPMYINANGDSWIYAVGPEGIPTEWQIEFLSYKESNRDNYLSFKSINTDGWIMDSVFEKNDYGFISTGSNFNTPGHWTVTPTVTPVPEPSTIFLLLAGFAILARFTTLKRK
ncbi:MAG: PEP-CTERM sorting domain-containing protein [Verrucomicrobia bacterium]|nr:PEP-CTERM sorting domain-containing protein [Deltaproteobacteria bacterium]